MTITAGALREQIELQRATTIDDGAGGSVRSWSTYATRRAQVLAANGRERAGEDVVQSVQTFSITIRFGLDILPTDRLVWRGRVMNIRGYPVDPDGRRASLVITADSGVPVD